MADEQQELLPIGFESKDVISPAASATVECNPLERDVQPIGLHVDEYIARMFAIEDVLCDGQRQFVASGLVPATVFSPSGPGPKLKLDVVPRGKTMQIKVTNLGGAPTRFRASVTVRPAGD